MSDVDKNVRRALLKPLLSRKSRSSERQYAEALNALDERVVGENSLEQNRALLLDAKASDRAERWKNPDYTARSIGLAAALYASRRISKSEYVFYAGFPIESLHDSRLQDGHYEAVLGPISDAIRQIERDHGLLPDHFWLRGQGPRKYTLLIQQYDKLLDQKFGETLREFGLMDLSTLWETDREEFDRLRERGRRSVFHKDEYVQALQDAIFQCESEARRAAAGGAYTAAITSLGSGVEGLLLLRCLRSPAKSRRHAAKLSKSVRPRANADPGTWRFETLIEVCLAAGWLRPVETKLATYYTSGLAHLLRSMRNYVHPGKCARERPWTTMTEREYRDAESIYAVLATTLGKSRSR
jgi:hypothetical protein